MTLTREQAAPWPDRLVLRDTRVTADEGQRIYSTSTGYGYEKREYVRADLVSPAPTASPDFDARLAAVEAAGFARLVMDGVAAGKKAMAKFPQPNYVISKFAEESGEVVKAAIHCAESRETFENVRGEIVQTIGMLYRLWVEGDQVHGLKPLMTGEKAVADDYMDLHPVDGRPWTSEPPRHLSAESLTCAMVVMTDGEILDKVAYLHAYPDIMARQAIRLTRASVIAEIEAMRGPDDAPQWNAAIDHILKVVRK